jgi:hypothetical protein
MVKCQLCRLNEALWAMQYIDGEFTFTLLGSHYRGSRVVKVCDACKEKEIIIQNMNGDAS